MKHPRTILESAPELHRTTTLSGRGRLLGWSLSPFLCVAVLGLLCGCQSIRPFAEEPTATPTTQPIPLPDTGDDLAVPQARSAPAISGEQPVSSLAAAPGGEDPVATSSVPSVSIPSIAKAPPAPQVRTVGYQQQIDVESDVTLAPNAEPVPNPDPNLPSQLTLTELEGVALQNNPAVSEAASRVQAARGNWLQVGLPPNPTAGYSGSEIGNEGAGGQQGGYAGQKIILGRKLRLNREVAAWEVQRAERELDAARMRVLTDTRIGYYDVLIAQRRREVATELVRISEEGVRAAQALFQGEEVSEADPLRARVAADSARIVLQNAVNQHAESWRRVTAVVGVPDMTTRQIDGELKPGDIDMAWQDELRRILTDSPEIAAAMADVEAARWAINRAYAQVIPDVTFQAGVAHDNATGDAIANVTIQLPIPLLNRNQGGILQAQAQAMAAQRAVDRVALDLQTRLAVAYQRYESASNQVRQYSQQGGIIDNARRTLELIRAGYQAEEFGVLDLLTAQRTYFQTTLAYLDSLRQLWTAVMEIRGMLLKDSLTR
ncbi:MAG: TolC family protein [Pirellulales bacterium]